MFRFQTSNSPVECAVRQGIKPGGTHADSPVLNYQCHCSSGYVQDTDGVCRLFWSPGRLAGLLFGAGALALLASAPYLVRLWRRRRRLAFDLDLHRGLLEETASDVVALKRAWEIDWRDLTLTTRIDEGAEGAFGEVGPLSDVH